MAAALPLFPRTHSAGADCDIFDQTTKLKFDAGRNQKLSSSMKSHTVRDVLLAKQAGHQSPCIRAIANAVLKERISAAEVE